jgi:hypothetical protein
VGWLGELAVKPERFAEVVTPASKDGWIAIHRNDWLSALEAGGAPANRAADELEVFYGVLAEVSAQVWKDLSIAWSKRALPSGSYLPLFFSLALPQEQAQAYKKLADSLDKSLVLARQDQHKLLLQGKQSLGQFRALVTRPVLTEPVSGAPGVSRELYDPEVYRSLQALMASYPSATGFEAELFSASGLVVELPENDDPDACHSLGFSVKEQLQQIEALATHEEARALFNDLQLVEATSSRMLVALARQALPTRPRCALTLAGIALDYGHARMVGPINSPTLFAVLAAGWLQTGRIGEAADMIERLVEGFPELIPLDETLGDLLAFSSAGRSGDSRE